MSAGIPTEELDRVVESYRVWRAADLRHGPSAAARAQLTAVEAAARKLAKAVSVLDERARDALFEHLPRELNRVHGLLGSQTGLLLDPGVARDQIGLLNTALAESAAHITTNMPKKATDNSAARMVAEQLRALFEHHGFQFSATATEYGNNSAAVEALLTVVRQAGHDMTPAAARHWIEFALDEQKIRETTRPNSMDRFPIP